MKDFVSRSLLEINIHQKLIVLVLN
jgi:hypothetical protein